MDYELFFNDAQPLIKEVKEKTALQSKTVNKVEKCILDGDLNALPKLFTVLRNATREREEALNRLEAYTETFDGREYIVSGDFSAQMIECCQQLGVDVHGSFPVYEMFPCRVTINAETQDITVDRKHLPYLRPLKVIGDIKKERDKLAKGSASFNAQQFAKELAAAYDIAIIKASKKKHCADNAPIYAHELYDILTPMKRYKKDYTKQNYAYDLAHLYAAERVSLEDGRIVRFDTARDIRKAVRILDGYGAEQFITTVRFS